MAGTPIGRILLMPQGNYSGTATYNSLDWVRDNGAAWVCKVDGTVGIAPPTLPATSNANWQLLAEDGTVSGTVDWSNVNYKPFNTVGSGLNVNLSSQLELDTSYLTGSRVAYDNTGSGATATDVQAAIDEIFAGGLGGLTDAFDEVEIGGVSLTASGADTLHLLAGSNITLTPNAGTNTVEISSTGGGGGGGHTMLPDPTSTPAPDEADVVSAINTAITLDGGANDDVASLFGIGKWSNTMTKTYTVTGSTHISETGIGTWPADPDNPSSAEKATWITIPMLIGAGSNNNLDIKLTFDPTTVSVPITLGGYVIDDSDGTMCLKFGNEIPSADTATAIIGIEVIIRRTETVAVS